MQMGKKVKFKRPFESWIYIPMIPYEEKKTSESRQKSYLHALRICCHSNYDQNQVHLFPSVTIASYYKSKVCTFKMVAATMLQQKPTRTTSLISPSKPKICFSSSFRKGERNYAYMRSY